MDNVETKVPKVRFPGFTDPWEQRKLSEVCKRITDGSHFSPAEVEEGYPMPSVKDMTENGFNYASCKKISKEDYDVLVNQGCKPEMGDVLVAKDGSILKYAFVIKENQEVVILSSIAILKPNSQYIDGGYLAQYFKIEEFKKRVIDENTTGTGVPRIVLTNFKNFEISFPSLAEQQRISVFLEELDNTITLHQRELDALNKQKKAVMKKIFSQEVRFKRADGSEFPEWEDGCFGDLIEIYDERVTAECTLPVLTSSKQYGIQYQRDHFAKEQQHDITGYGVLPRGYCTYRNRSDGTDFTFNINNLCDKGIVSKFYPVFKATDRCVLYFLMTLLNNEPSTVKKISVTAKGTGQKVLSFLDLQKICIPIPCLEEQHLIADFLSNFDEAISAAKKELELWKKLKKGLLQQMFV